MGPTMYGFTLEEILFHKNVFVVVKQYVKGDMDFVVTLSGRGTSSHHTS
jgi:hypothetical protein